MDYTQLGRTGLKVSRLCLGTMNFELTQPRKIRLPSWIKHWIWELIFLIQPMSMDGKQGKELQRISSAAGLRRVEGGVTKRSSRPKCTAGWEPGPINRGFLP